MGVQGLLPTLQSITKSVSLERYRGLSVAIDAMSWLHKGLLACNVKALAKSQRSDENMSTEDELESINYTIQKAVEQNSITYTTGKAEILQKFGMNVILET